MSLENYLQYVIAMRRIADAQKKGSEMLNLSELNLKEIPKEIQNLTNLRILSLSNNQITAIENLEGLPFLESLYLNGNLIDISLAHSYIYKMMPNCTLHI